MIAGVIGAEPGEERQSGINAFLERQVKVRDTFCQEIDSQQNKPGQIGDEKRMAVEFHIESAPEMVSNSIARLSYFFIPAAPFVTLVFLGEKTGVDRADVLHRNENFRRDFPGDL